MQTTGRARTLTGRSAMEITPLGLFAAIFMAFVAAVCLVILIDVFFGRND
jgi:hypothetical protein